MQTNTMQHIFAVLVLAISLALWPSGAQATQPEGEIDCTGATEPITLHYGDHTINCEINPATDLDTFNFIGAADDQIRVVVLGTSTNLFSPRLEVRDPTAAVIKDTFCSPPNSITTCSFTVDLSLTLSGIYSLAVSDKFSSKSGGYQVNLQCLVGICPPLPHVNLVFHYRTVFNF